MKQGEKSWVYVTDPKYGYGDKGSFSFPSVPPKAQLVYEVELVAWEEPQEVSQGGGNAKP
jgi:FKBP-type peptidyl-prolyl cis-trans isomerase